MKSQNSEIYFLLLDYNSYWYGKYDCIKTGFSWASPKNNINELTFTLSKVDEPSYATFEQLAKEYLIIHQQSTPFDFTYLQTHYPELLI